MFSRMILIFFLGIVVIGCGEDVPTEPGEEIVSDKWIEPKDIGKEYSVREPKVGETVTLSTGEKYKITGADFTELTDEGLLLQTIEGFPHPDDIAAFIATGTIERGYVVPDGDPIVSLVSWFGKEIQHVTKDRSVIDYVHFYTGIHIDRVLDYNLPIYLEYRTQDRPELGNEVRVIRFLAVVPKGEMRADTGFTFGLHAGDREKHEKAYVSVLPHTEMKKIDLPAAVGFPGKTEELRVELRGIPEGHKFRPYRIRSSSFLMGNTESSADW